jgi:catechol 2,3-dioxygenase-like lactoylglutathione lyase family enzyme
VRHQGVGEGVRGRPHNGALAASEHPALTAGPCHACGALGLRNVAFEVDDIEAAVERAGADGYELIGGIGEYEHTWRMAYVRGPEGLIVSLAQRIA